jgi:hypothetical protein
LGLGVFARLLSTLVSHYASWLFHRVSDEDEEPDFWDDLCAFGDWLLQVTAGWFIGWRSNSYAQDGDGWEPGLYR